MFAELLPWEESWHDSCEHCERHLERRESRKAPRNYQLVARGIAEALEAVGAGATYMRASRVARHQARRFRFDAETGELRESDHGQLVADWSCSRRSSSSPTVPPPGLRRARCCLTICPSGSEPWTPAGGGSRRVGSPSMSSARSATGPASRGSGVQGPSRAPIPPTGGPSSALCPTSRGGSSATPTAACCRRSRSASPRRSCTNANGTFSIAGTPARQGAEAHPEPGVRGAAGPAEGALVGPSFWHPFVRAARVVENESLDRWIAVNGQTIESQFARRAPASRRPTDMPLTTAALEQITRPSVTALYPRRCALKNRERLNRLLMLLQLHLNGEDSVQAYAKTIRAWLEANDGRPVGSRRAIADPAGSRSLR